MTETKEAKLTGFVAVETARVDLHRALAFLSTRLYNWNSDILDHDEWERTAKMFLAEYGIKGPGPTIYNPTPEQFVNFLVDACEFWQCKVCDSLTHPDHADCGSCRIKRNASRPTILWGAFTWKLYRRKKHFQVLENPDYGSGGENL